MAPTVEKSKKADKADKAEKKAHKEEKKARKEQKVLDGGITKPKKDKKSKDKKDKKAKRNAEALLSEHSKNEDKSAQDDSASSDDEDETQVNAATGNTVTSVDLLAPFALPLASLAQEKGIFDAVADASKLCVAARGVRECKKVIKKAHTEPQDYVCIVAADVAPFEVTEAFPSICEDAKVRYIFCHHRSELGGAANTKRATAVTVLKRQPKDKKAHEKLQSEIPGYDKLLAKYNAKVDKLITMIDTEFERQVLPWIKGTHRAQMSVSKKTSA